MKLSIFFIALSFSIHARAQVTIQTVEDAVKLVLRDHRFTEEEQRSISTFSFRDAFEKAMVTSLVLAHTENEKGAQQGKVILEEFITQAPAGWQRDYAQMTHAVFLQITNQHKEGAEEMENLLKKADFKAIATADDPFSKLMKSRTGLPSIPYEDYLKESLLFSLGHYYMDRRPEDGGPDYEKARDAFDQMMGGARKEAVGELEFRAKERGIKLAARKSTDIPREVTGQAPNLLHSNLDQTAINTVQTEPVITEKQPNPLATKEESKSWLIWLILILTALTGIWWLMRKPSR
jgi:hypothetical protein